MFVVGVFVAVRVVNKVVEFIWEVGVWDISDPGKSNGKGLFGYSGFVVAISFVSKEL